MDSEFVPIAYNYDCNGEKDCPHNWRSFDSEESDDITSMIDNY